MDRESLLKSIQARTLSPQWKTLFETLLGAHQAYHESLKEEYEALVYAKHDVLAAILEKKASLATLLEQLEYGFKCAILECRRAFSMESISLVLDRFISEGSPVEQGLASEVQALRIELQESLKSNLRQGQLNASLIQQSLRYIHDLRLQLEPDLQTRTQYGAKGQRASLGSANQLEQTL